MSLQGQRQASVRALTGTAYTYEGDFHALFDLAGIPAGDFNGRLLSWLKIQGATANDLPGAMQQYAVSQGAPSWAGLGSLGPPPASVFILREDGSFLLREDGSRFIREAA